jgi:4-hydroxy-tetrahydrodipicolinate synthase
MGADALMVLPPYFLKTDADGLLHYFDAIGRAVHIPIMVLNGQFFIEEVERGARGTMPGSDMTAVYVRIWNALERKDITAAWEAFTQALPLIRFELQPGMGVSAMKHNLVAEGVIRSAAVRHPTVSLSSESLAELAFLRSWIGSSATCA